MKISTSAAARPPGSSPSSRRHHSYSRKQKSLGLLCTNFVALYDREDTHVIGLDDAASQLGVERRRIYDIVNVLESVGVLARKAKNQYTWKGFGAIPKALQQLKDEGFKEGFYSVHNSGKVSDDYGDEENDDSDSNPNTGSQNNSSAPDGSLESGVLPKSDNKKEKSLGLLTQNFVKLFVCSNVNMISLEEAAKLLLGDAHNLSILRTKVRRLYDIANVLSSMKLIEKTHSAVSRKPAFRWLGMSNKQEVGSSNKQEVGSSNNEANSKSKTRAFGADITNICFKRNKVDFSTNENKDRNPKMQKKVKTENVQNVVDRSNSGQDSRQASRSYQFGPFAPVSGPKIDDLENKVTQKHDWESLASTHRPRYHNQALSDLFSHYMDAWKSWYSEAAEKKSLA